MTSNKHLVVIGVGALGSHLIQFIRNLDAQVTIVDFDYVERKNTLSQFHPKGSTSKNKVVSLSQTMNFLWGLKIIGIPNKLTVDNADVLLGTADLVIDCLDNAEARKIVQNTVRKHSVPCLHGALAADGAFGRVIWDESFKIDDETGAGAATCENGEFLPFIGIVSTFLAEAVRKFVVSGCKIGYSISPGGVIRV